MKLGITMLIHNKDDIEFVTEFPCFLGHPVLYCTLLCRLYILQLLYVTLYTGPNQIVVVYIYN